MAKRAKPAKPAKPAAAVVPAPEPSALVSILDPTELRVLVERPGDTPLDAAADAGEVHGHRVRIGGLIHDHCATTADGRWIYRKG